MEDSPRQIHLKKLSNRSRKLSITSSNALLHMDELEKQIAGKRVAVFLDYDGTLTPIVNDPERAFLSQEMRSLLQELRLHYTAGVISGRSLQKIKTLVGIDGLFYAGSHGFDIEGPEGCHLRHQVASEYLALLADTKDKLMQKTEVYSGSTVEDNVFAVSVHYRNAPQHKDSIEATVDGIIKETPELKKSEGKMVFEIRPRLEWNKGKAVVWLLEALGLDKRDDVYTIYVGDDITDEDAFNVLHPEEGRKGIVVTDTTTDSAAHLTLQDPQEVGRFLTSLIAFSRSIAPQN